MPDPAAAWIVYVKEMVDALRDRRTLLVVLVSSVLLGPLVLVAASSLVASLEVTAESRDLYVEGIERAPTLRNYLQRQTFVLKAAPEDFAAASRRPRAREAVLRIPPGFEEALRGGEAPRLELLYDSSDAQSQSSARRMERLVAGFNRERNMLALALRGVAPRVIEAVELEGRDLASRGSRAAQFTAMLPFFVMMAVLYGALHAALDTTAGERERGSLEPLLMNPPPRSSLVLGKWAAVATLAMMVAVLSSFSFLPAQALLRSETLAAMFMYGWREALLFLAVLAPFAAALAAVLMAVAIRCRSFKEAQASSTVVVLTVSLLPLVTLFNPGSEASWQLWVPALAQNVLMGRVLRGEAFAAGEFLAPLATCVVLTVAALSAVGLKLRTAVK